MLAKTREKEKARELRKQGWSIRKISQEINVSKGSVSVWVRDIELTEQQKKILINNKETTNRNLLASKAIKEKYTQQRIQYRQNGFKKASEMDAFHMAGCMLYWAEGGKSKNSLDFANSDLKMISFFMQFLREYFYDYIPKIKLYINCYLNNGLTTDDIKNKWLSITGLEDNQLKHIHIGIITENRGSKKGKLPYGVCRINLNCTNVLQHIYGALQKYANIDINPILL